MQADITLAGMALNKIRTYFHGTFVFFVFAYAVEGAPKISNPLAPPGSWQEVVGGTDAAKDEFPWQVLIKYDGRALCGGSIINKRTILTAAHCTEDDRNQRWGTYKVIAGEYDRSTSEGTEQTLKVAQIKMHKKYDRIELYNDIALLILDADLVYTTSVQPVPALSTAGFDQAALNKTNCVVTGWGISNDFTDRSPKILQQLTSTNIITHKECKNLMADLKVTQKMICASDIDSGFCDGDSGGPMGCYDNNGTFTQVGVVSWSKGKCRHGKQVYTRVSKYLKWIRKKKAKTS